VGSLLGSLALLSVVETMAHGQGGWRLRYTGATAMALSVMETEIRSQPAMLARLAEDTAPLVRELGRAVARRRPRFVVLAARGSSDHAAIYGKYLLETQAGLVASLAAPSVYSVYGRSPDVRDALTVGISQSGQSPDIVSAIDGARRAGALALAITNDESSPLARAADLVLPLGVGPERSVAATKTFTAELLALWLLVAAIADADPAPAHRVAEQAAQALAAAEQALAGFTLGGAASPVVVAGRGYSFPIALEIALKLREVGVRNAQGFSAADLLHGHIAAVQTDTAAVVAGMAGPSLPSLRECAAALRARGARTVVISDDPALRESADIAVPVQAATESLAAIPMTVVGQWLTLQDAISRGLDPDRPPGLTKIVRTV
jgi:glutamine---fructose-6-phosphate transaminase (isomerizing)